MSDPTLLCIIDALGLGDPLQGCVSAEPRSVSPDNDESTQSTLIEHSPCLKKSRGLGLAPRILGKIATCLLTKFRTVADTFFRTQGMAGVQHQFAVETYAVGVHTARTDADPGEHADEEGAFSGYNAQTLAEDVPHAIMHYKVRLDPMVGTAGAGGFMSIEMEGEGFYYQWNGLVWTKYDLNWNYIDSKLSFNEHKAKALGPWSEGDEILVEVHGTAGHNAYDEAVDSSGAFTHVKVYAKHL